VLFIRAEAVAARHGRCLRDINNGHRHGTQVVTKIRRPRRSLGGRRTRRIVTLFLVSELQGGPVLSALARFMGKGFGGAFLTRATETA
jgi:hypothetical protein